MSASAPEPGRGGDDELVVLDDPDRARVGVHELRCLLHDLVEDRGRVELGREQPAGAGQLLRERTGAALRLEELAALERAARRIGEVARELEVVVGEDALLREEDGDEAARLVPRRLDGDGEERLVAVRSAAARHVVRKPLVVRERSAPR